MKSGLRQRDLETSFRPLDSYLTEAEMQQSMVQFSTKIAIRPARRLPRILAIVFLLGCWPASSHAQGDSGREPPRGPIILTLPGSTRALSLGNAFLLGSRDSDVLFYNPGLLDRAQGFAGSLQLYGSSSSLATFSAGTSWFSGNVAIGIQSLSYGVESAQVLLGDDAPGYPTDPGSLRDNGDVGVGELVVSAGYSRTLFGIRMGLAGKYIQERFGRSRANTGAVDLGAAKNAGPVTLGLAAQNIGGTISIPGEDVSLPTRFTLGAGSQSKVVGPLDVSAATALSYQLDGDLIPSIGLEVAYWPVTGRTFFARMGFRHLPEEMSGTPLTFGGGFTGDSIVLDYAYEGFDKGTPSHRFTLGWR
mgnify:FL=1